MHSLKLFRPLASQNGTPIDWTETPEELATILSILAKRNKDAPKSPNSTPGYLLADSPDDNVGRSARDIVSRSWAVLDVDGVTDADTAAIKAWLRGYPCVAQRSLGGQGWHLHIPLATPAGPAEYDEIIAALAAKLPGLDAAGSRWAQTLYIGRGDAEVWCPDGVPLYIEGTAHAVRSAVDLGDRFACARGNGRCRLSGSRDALRIRIAGHLGRKLADGEIGQGDIETFWAAHFAGPGYTAEPSADSSPALMVRRTIAFAEGDKESAPPPRKRGRPGKQRDDQGADAREGVLAAWREELAGQYYRCSHDEEMFVSAATGRLSSRRKLCQSLARKFDPDAVERPFDVFGDMLAVGLVDDVDMRGVFDAPGAGWIVERDGRSMVNRSAHIVTPSKPPPGWSPAGRWGQWVGAFSAEAKAFLGHIIARPWEKPNVCLVLQGPSGEGKSSVVSALLRAILPNLPDHNDIVGREQVCQRSLRAVTGRFNGDTATKLVVCLGEEDTAGQGGAARRAEKLEQINILKELITDPELAYERKGAEVIRIENRTRYIMTTEQYLTDPSTNLAIGNRRFLHQPVFAGLHLDPAGADAMFDDIAAHPEWYAWALLQYWEQAPQAVRDTILHGVRPSGEDLIEGGSAMAFGQVMRDCLEGAHDGELANPTLPQHKLGGTVRSSMGYDEVRALCGETYEIGGVVYVRAAAFGELANVWCGKILRGKQIAAFHEGMHVGVASEMLKVTARIDGATVKLRAVYRVGAS